jgi:hypothetical protein
VERVQGFGVSHERAAQTLGPAVAHKVRLPDPAWRETEGESCLMSRFRCERVIPFSLVQSVSKIEQIPAICCVVVRQSSVKMTCLQPSFARRIDSIFKPSLKLKPERRVIEVRGVSMTWVLFYTFFIETFAKPWQSSPIPCWRYQKSRRLLFVRQPLTAPNLMCAQINVLVVGVRKLQEAKVEQTDCSSTFVLLRLTTTSTTIVWHILEARSL